MHMCKRTKVYIFLNIQRWSAQIDIVCVHAQVNMRGAIRVGWFSKEFHYKSCCKSMWMPLRGKETKVGRQREEETERVRQRMKCCDSWFLLPNWSHSRKRCRKPLSQPCEDDKRMEVAPDSTRQAWFQAAISWLHETVMLRNVDKLFKELLIL